MPSSPHVVSIQTGRLRQFDSPEDTDVGTAKPWESAIVKQPVRGPVSVFTENIDGDHQADLVHHGGADKAVCAYASEHFEFWSRTYPEIDWRPGCFGENLTLSGLLEPDVCIGDTFEVGDCVLQISQPRQPCWKLSLRWNLPKLAVRVQQTRFTGWYFRVLQSGIVEADNVMRLTDRQYPQWSITAANDVMFAKPRDPASDLALADCPALSQSWRESLTQRAV